MHIARKQGVQTTLAQFKDVYKHEISLLVEDAIGKLEKVDAQAEGQKKQIVVDLAKSLEGKIPTDTIFMEIVDKLHGRVSPRFIRECLEEKYKQKARVDNARKQNRQPQCKIDNKLAALPPLNAVVGTEGITILDADNLMPLSGNNADNKSSATVIDASAADITIAELPYEQQEEQEQQIVKQINPKDKEECQNCKDLYTKNLELEEALAKSNQMITADKMVSTSTDDHDKENNNEILNFEFFMPYGELQKHMASLYQKASSVEVWFCGKIHKNTRKVLSPKLGKLSQYQQ